MMKKIFISFLYLGIVNLSFGQSVEQILSKHYDALGGKKKLLEIETIVKKRRIILDQVGVSINSTSTIDIRNGYRVDIEASPAMPGRSEVYNKEKKEAYLIQRSGTSKTSDNRAAYFANALRDIPSPFMGKNMTLLDTEKVNEQICFVLKRSDGNKYWISKESYLIIQSYTNLYHEELGAVKVTTQYRDYKNVNGINLPFEHEILEYGQRIEMISITLNTFIDQKLFNLDSSTKGASQIQIKETQLPSPDEYPQKVFNKTKSYYASINAMASIEDKYQGTLLKGYFYDLYSTNLAIAGMYKEALRAKERASDFGDTPKRSIDLNKFKPVNAISEIASLADRHQAIFINEAHHVPQHRAFTHQLLQILYDKGYRYFAAETLAPEDTDIIKSKNLMLAYINEPEYADLIRSALKIGYKIIPYEQLASEQITASNNKNTQRESINSREQAQATHLKEKIFDKDEHAKILVHAGYDHILEKRHMGYEMMAARFKKMTGVDPLTIDQVALMERGVFERSNPFYKYIVQQISPKDYTILKNSENEYWTTQDKKGKVDLQLIHPRTTYEKGRPTWKKLGGIREAVSVTMDTPMNGLAEVFVKGEKNGVPIDRVFIDKELTSLVLYLPKGDFELIITDENGKRIKAQTISN